MILWLTTAGAVLAMVLIVGAYGITRRQYRRMPAPNFRQNPGICSYVHVKNALNIYQQGDYPALKKEYEERIRNYREGKFGAQIHGMGAQAGRETEEETIARYMKDEGPITVVGRITDAFDSTHNIVYVDLFNKLLEPGVGLDRALSATYHRNASRQRSARLRDLRPLVWVSVMGRFRVTDKTDRTITFSAPYGDPDDPATEPQQVNVTCATAQWPIEDVPQGPFPARCLGRVQNWDPDNQRLVIDPLAMFQ